MAAPPRRIILSNDDGAPSPDSPFIESFVQSLYRVLGLKLNGVEKADTPWSETSLSVVIPSSQRSWIGKSYLINEVNWWTGDV
jgi:broad specificity polyphosphatase/5'/3'-nucleotidase SurE